MTDAGLLASLPLNELAFLINKGLLAGLIIGSVYALGAVGVTLVFGILRFAHFPHGDMMTAGAFFALVGVHVLSDWQPALPTAFVLLPVAMLATALFAIGLDRAIYRPLRATKVKPVVIVMASIGVMLMLQGAIRLLAGTRSWQMDDRPKLIYRWGIGDGMVVLTQPQLLLIAFTLTSAVLLHIFLSRTRTGRAMRAMADNPDLARVSGVSPDGVVNIVWLIAGALAAAGGTLLALDVMLKPDLSFNLLLPIFAATILGGIGRPFGAMAGGLIVGFAETLAVFNWAVVLRPIAPDWLALPAKITFVPTEYKIVVPFVILVCVLVWRPTGLLRGSKVLT